jgi:hypothetical protein
MQYHLETDAGAVEKLPGVTNDDEACALATRIYDYGPNEDQDPEQWVVKSEHDGDEDLFLVPGGPGGEDFTWVPRSLWDGGMQELIEEATRTPPAAGGAQ